MKSESDPAGCVVEEKFAVSVVDTADLHTTVHGNHPLQPFRKGARGTYGGELVSQAVNAAWATLDDPELTPHSLHSYFVKAGSDETVMVWEVQHVSDTRNYANRLVQGFQGKGGRLVYVCQMSFTRGNDGAARLAAAAAKAKAVAAQGGIAPQLPLHFQAKPSYVFDKYRHRLDDMHFHTHTFDLIQHIIPPEHEHENRLFDPSSAGNNQFGFFFRANDDWRRARDPTRARFLQLAFLSDSAFLSNMEAALGLRIPIRPTSPAAVANNSFFRVSLDHTVHFHDSEFDPSAWLYMDYSFSRLNNDRVLCQCVVYTLEGTMVASVVQEGLVYITDEIASRVRRIGVDYDDSAAKL